MNSAVFVFVVLDIVIYIHILLNLFAYIVVIINKLERDFKLKFNNSY